MQFPCTVHGTGEFLHLVYEDFAASQWLEEEHSAREDRKRYAETAKQDIGLKMVTKTKTNL